jgi:hypothetical protein
VSTFLCVDVDILTVGNLDVDKRTWHLQLQLLNRMKLQHKDLKSLNQSNELTSEGSMRADIISAKSNWATMFFMTVA